MPKSTPPRHKYIKPAAQKPNISYFMVAILAIYERGEIVKQRHLNVMIELPSPQITKANLSDIQRSAIARLHAENNVEVSAVRDIVILNISMLGVMPAEAFHGQQDDISKAH